MGNTPATWKCSKCKRVTFHEYEGGPRVAKRGNPIPTGEFRRDARTTKVTLQYKCSVCDFTGWTCHPGHGGWFRTRILKSQNLGRRRDV